MLRFLLTLGLGLFASATAQAKCSSLWQQRFPADQRPFDGVHVVETLGSTVYAMAEQSEGEVVLVTLALDAGPAKVSSVVALEPNRSAALIPLADGALLFDGHGQAVRVQAGERGDVLWSVDLLGPPVETRGNSVSLAENGFLVAGQDVKGPISVAGKLRADGTLAWRWRSADFAEATHVAGLPDGGAAVVSQSTDGKAFLSRLSSEGQELYRRDVPGEVLQIGRRSDAVAILAEIKGALSLLSYDAQSGEMLPIPLKLPARARTTELRESESGWSVSGSWPGERDGATEVVPPQAWVRSVVVQIDGVPLYRPRVIGRGKLLGIRGSRLEVCGIK